MSPEFEDSYLWYILGNSHLLSLQTFPVPLSFSSPSSMPMQSMFVPFKLTCSTSFIFSILATVFCTLVLPSDLSSLLILFTTESNLLRIIFFIFRISTLFFYARSWFMCMFLVTFYFWYHFLKPFKSRKLILYSTDCSIIRGSRGLILLFILSTFMHRNLFLPICEFIVNQALYPWESFAAWVKDTCL